MWAGQTGGIEKVWWGGVLGTAEAAEAFSGLPREPPAGPGGGCEAILPALIEVAGTAQSVVGNGLGLSGIEAGGLVEVVGEGFLDGLVLVPPVGPFGPHGALGLGWAPGGMEEWGGGRLPDVGEYVGDGLGVVG